MASLRVRHFSVFPLCIYDVSSVSATSDSEFFSEVASFCFSTSGKGVSGTSDSAGFCKRLRIAAFLLLGRV